MWDSARVLLDVRRVVIGVLHPVWRVEGRAERDLEPLSDDRRARVPWGAPEAEGRVVGTVHCLRPADVDVWDFEGVLL